MRHPLPLLTHEVAPAALDRRTAVLMLDMHAPFTDIEDGWLACEARRKILMREFDEHVAMVPDVLHNARRLLDSARGLGLEVHWACWGHRQEEPSALQRAMGWEWDLDGPDGRFPADVRPAPGEFVHAKPGWGALSSSSLRAALSDADTLSVILVGLPLDFGVRQSCFELADAGYRLLLLSDATAPLTSAAEGPAKGNLTHGATKLRSTAEVLDLIAKFPAEDCVWA